jgi:Domain of unknown function (DUF5916)
VLGGLVSNPAQGVRGLHTGGLDLKYGIHGNIVANLTVNTDFADADVDPLRVNITPFKNSLPEKRPFFLENGGSFRFGTEDSTQLFFSRQIGIDPNTGEQVPLDGGAKITGTLGNYDIGFLDVRTRESGPNPWANYLVARVKKKILSESYIGAIAIDKESGNPLDPFNRAVGLDADFLLFKRLRLSGYYEHECTPSLACDAGQSPQPRRSLVRGRTPWGYEMLYMDTGSVARQLGPGWYDRENRSRWMAPSGRGERRRIALGDTGGRSPRCSSWRPGRPQRWHRSPG